jgi:hypothetical protein
LSARNRLAAGAGAAVLALVPVVALSAAAGASGDKITPPKAGAQYSGHTAQGRKLTLNIADSKSVQIIAFKFTCGKVVASTSLTDIKISKPTKGKMFYRFSISAHSIVSFSDNGVDENAALVVKGIFSHDAKSVSRYVRIRSPRCGDTGRIKWKAQR